MKLHLPAPGRLTPNDEHDPLPYYYHPLVGWLYRRRLQMALDLLPAGGTRALEVGVGSGILIPTLTARYPEYRGSDLVLASGLDGLVAPSCRASFIAADLQDPSSLPAEHYDVVLCLSVLEHIADAERAAAALARCLVSGGTLVAGYPMVNGLMTHLFRAIGFRNIEAHHVTAPARIQRALARVLHLAKRTALPPLAPTSLALYQCSAWVKR
ncbi:MAG: methyltransferase domain-containing protein [Polyangia bacterium]